MNINWKDFGLMFAIGIMIFIIGIEVISLTNEVAPLFVLLLFLISLFYKK